MMLVYMYMDMDMLPSEKSRKSYTVGNNLHVFDK